MARPDRSRLLTLGAIGAAGLLLAARPASPPAGASGPASRLAALLLGPTPIEDDLRALCDRIGGRATGGPGCERAIDWAAARFRDAGADTVRVEPFPLPHRWEERRSRLTITAPIEADLALAAMPFSPATPPGGVEAAVVYMGDGGDEAFRVAGPRAGGALLLVDSRILGSWEDLFDDYLRMPPIIERARRAGAAGLLLVGGRERRLLYRHVASFGVIAPLPMAVVAREDGLRLARLSIAEQARARLELAVTAGGPFTSGNVVAEIAGRRGGREIVLVGAHLDSWDLGTGALDNGANCALVIDLARQMAALRERPRRTVRFVLFTGEEQGMFGSLGYARDHRGELDRHAAVVIIDTGTGRISGFSLGGRDALRPAVEVALRPVAGYAASDHTADAFVGTDNFDFLLEGVPNLVANQTIANYLENYHASSDTLDKADLRELKINAAIVAALVWDLADSSGRAPRQDRAAVQALLQATGLEAQMKTFGLWESWSSGVRGRAE